MAVRKRCPNHGERQAGCPRCEGAGSWGHIPNEPVRAAVDRLRKAGMTLPVIAHLAGVPLATVAGVARSRCDLVHWSTAAAIAAVVPARTAPRAGFVDPVGTVRRVRALMALGYSQSWIAEQLGVTVNQVWLWVHGKASRLDQDVALVSVRHAAAVAGLYERVGITLAGPGVGATRARNLAARSGWVGPLAWEDVDIDDPAAVPVVDADPDPDYVDEVAVTRVLRGDRKVALGLTPADRAAVARAALAQGMSTSALAELLRTNLHGRWFTAVLAEADPQVAA